MSDTDLTTEQWLAHYGVKGMKWGVRKRYNEKRGAEVQSLRRVAAGKGSAGDKLSALAKSSLLELALNKGLKNTAKFRANDIQAHLKRVNTGNKTARDLMVMAGHLSLADIAAGGRDKYRKSK